MRKIVFLLTILGVGMFCFSIHADGVDQYTKLMIHSDTTDLDTTFEDSSSSTHSITPNGDVHHSTLEAEFGYTSIKFDGDDDYLAIPDSPDWDFGSSDFTIDFWAKIDGTSRQSFCAQWGSGITWAWYFGYNHTTTNLEFQYSETGVSPDFVRKTVSWTKDSNWHHFAVVRSGTNIKFFVDGSQVGTDQSIGSVSFYNSASEVQIGIVDIVLDFNGHMDELRISKGIARWTSGFTPPIAPYGCAADYNNDGIIDELDLEDKRSDVMTDAMNNAMNNAMQEIQSWVENCWLPEMNCN